MHKYEVIIYWSQEDDAFIAEVPELPGYEFSPLAVSNYWVRRWLASK